MKRLNARSPSCRLETAYHCDQCTDSRTSQVQRLVAFFLVLGLILAPIRDGRGQQTVAQWIEALRLSQETLSEDPATRQTSAVAQITFEPGSTAPTPTAVKSLNALASALTSPDYYRHFFVIVWYVDPNQKPIDPEQALAPRRAATLYELLQAKPGITPWRVMLHQSRKRPDGLSAKIEPNSLTIVVTDLGI